jgi:hypothetical protein
VDYDLTAGVDPSLNASILTPFAPDPDQDLLPFLTRLVVSDARGINQIDPEERVPNEDALADVVRDSLEELAERRENPAATITIEGDDRFRMEEGEDRRMTLTFQAEEQGLGAFAVKLVDEHDPSHISISEPTLYMNRGPWLILYDAVVDYGSDDSPGGFSPIRPVSPWTGSQAIVFPPVDPGGAWSGAE